MSTSALRKLHNYQEIFHINMVSIPFFYSDKPTSTLAMRNIPQHMLNDIQHNLMKKLYYKNNIPIITIIASFESIQKAQQYKLKLSQRMQSQNFKKYSCQFCKDITQLVGILFQGGKIFVTSPETKQLKQIIDAVSQMVVMNGAQIQQKLKISEQKTLSFLNERILSLQHSYYRWRVYSYLEGDGDKKYRNQEFQITKNGPFWYPPQNQALSMYPMVLNLKQAKYFTECLFKMERRKYAIQELMVFAIQHINYSVHIASIIIVQIYQNLKQDFMGIFYLISDILFNSTNHIYRNLFQSILPHVIYRYVLLKQNDCKNEIHQKYYNELKKLLSLWEKKFIFDEVFMKGLLFILQLSKIEKLYELGNYPQHQKIRQIFGGQQYLYELEKACLQNGIPFFEQKQEEAKIFLNALFWRNEQEVNVEPDLGKHDGEMISEKEIQKMQGKNGKIITCDGLPIQILYEKSWKIVKNQASYSIDN